MRHARPSQDSDPVPCTETYSAAEPTPLTQISSASAAPSTPRGGTGETETALALSKQAERNCRRKRVVRLYPLPAGASPDLAGVFGSVVAGAVRQCVDAHFPHMSKRDRGLLVGGIRKRAVNQLCCECGRKLLREVIGL